MARGSHDARHAHHATIFDTFPHPGPGRRNSQVESASPPICPRVRRPPARPDDMRSFWRGQHAAQEMPALVIEGETNVVGQEGAQCRSR